MTVNTGTPAIFPGVTVTSIFHAILVIRLQSLPLCFAQMISTQRVFYVCNVQYSIPAIIRNVVPSRVNWRRVVLPELIFVYSRWCINKFIILSRQLVLIESTML